MYPGRDGVSRVAKLRTATGELTRPVQRLYPLEIKSSTIKNEQDKDDSNKKPKTESKKVKNKSTTEKVSSRAGRNIKVPHRLDL